MNPTNSGSNPVRFALVGCGRIARLHAERVRADGRAELVSVMDSAQCAAEDIRDEFSPRATVFDDLNALLAGGGVDAVVISTPTHLHYEQALLCLERGLHVLCEKPLADSRERIVELIAAAERACRHFAVGYQRRYADIYRTLRREVLSGRWGEVRAVTSHNYEDWQSTITGTWRDDPRFNPGGFIGDAGSHKIDQVFYTTGLGPVEVFARSANFGSNVEISATVAATLTGGVPWNIDFVGNAQNLGEDLYVHCRDADLMIRDRRLWLGRKGSVEPIVDLEPDTNPVSSFIDLLHGQGENLSPPECALPVFDFTQAVLESCRTGRNVRIAATLR
jgi:predicted dehydrogenase